MTTIYTEGDNRLVTIPTANTTVVFTCNSINTSADDTTTEKYYDHAAFVGGQVLVTANQAVEITAINEVNFTEAIPVVSGANYSEGQHKGINSITIKTSTDNTVLRVRIR